MAYVKWVANADRHNDWTSELLLEDGTHIKQGVPIDLKAEVQKKLEAQGRIFESSSKDEREQYENSEQVLQPPGSDVFGTAPVFANAGGSNQTTVAAVQEAQSADTTDQTPDKPAAKQPAPQRGSNS